MAAQLRLRIVIYKIAMWVQVFRAMVMAKAYSVSQRCDVMIPCRRSLFDISVPSCKVLNFPLWRKILFFLM